MVAVLHCVVETTPVSALTLLDILSDSTDVLYRLLFKAEPCDWQLDLTPSCLCRNIAQAVASLLAHVASCTVIHIGIGTAWSAYREAPLPPPPRPCQSLSHFFFFIHLFICSPLKDNSLKELSHSQFLITLLCSLKPTPDSLFPITTSAKMFLLLSPVSCLLPNLGVSSPFSSYLTYYEYLTLLDLLPQVIFLFLNLDSSYSFGFSLKLASSFVSSKSSARPLPVRAP